MSLAAVRAVQSMYARLSEMSEMVLGCTTRTVVSRWGAVGKQREAWRTERSLKNRENQRGSEGLALLDSGKLRG